MKNYICIVIIISFYCVNINSVSAQNVYHYDFEEEENHKLEEESHKPEVHFEEGNIVVKYNNSDIRIYKPIDTTFQQDWMIINYRCKTVNNKDYLTAVFRTYSNGQNVITIYKGEKKNCIGNNVIAIINI